MELIFYGESQQLPFPGKAVLLRFINEYGYPTWARAVWLPEKFALTDEWGDYEGDDIVYDEEQDAYYWPKGWYEWNHYDERAGRIEGRQIIDWAYVPGLRKE